jgi:biotin-dependent carboxylase-like uncharacterized protein
VIRVLAPGLLTTVQDLGRVGSQRFGVPVSGAMDRWSLRAANRLVGNPDGAAALEITLGGPVLRFDGQGLIALAGADLDARLDGRPLAAWQSVPVGSGSTLAFGGARDGMRAYLALAGGIDVPVVLGSRSTFARSGLGGFRGRALRAGDRVPVGAGGASAPRRGRRIPRGAVPVYGHAHTLRAVLGPQDDAFTEEGIRLFFGERYTLASQSDRVGCRFAGPRIAHRAGADIVSDGTVFGAVQVTGDGLPIVLMADRGTTGGYTKIAAVASADLPRLAQARPGDHVRFERISAGEAQALLRDAEAQLDRIGRDEPGAEGAEAVYDEDSAAPLAAEGYGFLADALAARPAAPAARASTVRAAMPGLVVSVAVGGGEHVAAGQALLVLEAMKMQNPVRAPRAARVVRVHVSPGQLVGTAAPLVDLGDA